MTDRDESAEFLEDAEFVSPGPAESRAQLLRLSERLNLPAVELSRLRLDLADLALIPEEIARRHRVLPVLVKDDAVFLAMADASDKRVQEELEFVSGKRVCPFVALDDELRAVIDAVYAAREAGQDGWQGELYNPSVPPPMVPAEATATTTTTDPPPPQPTTSRPPSRGSLPPTPSAPPPASRPAPPTPPPFRSRSPTIVGGPAGSILPPPGTSATPPKVPPPPPGSHMAAPPPIPSSLSEASSPPPRRLPPPPSKEPEAVAEVEDVEVGAATVMMAHPAPNPLARAPEDEVPTGILRAPPPMPVSEPEAVTAPVRTPAPTVSSARAEATADPLRRQVLVVDAEDDSRRLLTSGLGDLGVEVVEFKRALEALAAMEKRTPAMLILDPELPDLHGFELLRRMGEVDRLSAVPVVLVSGRYNGWRFAADLRDAFGVRAFLPKPFGIVEAAARIERVLGARGDERPSELPITPDADRALRAGTEAYQRGDYEAAVQHLELGVRAAPESYRMHYQLALLLGRRGELFRAIAELECSVGLYAGFFPALKNLALLYEKAGFQKKALEAWERAVPTAPDEATRGQIKERVLSLL